MIAIAFEPLNSNSSKLINPTGVPVPDIAVVIVVRSKGWDDICLKQAIVVSMSQKKLKNK